MPASPSPTDRDRQAWARLWELARDPWDRTEDLAEVLGVSRSAVAQWATGTREGPWTMLRGALRRTARRYPVEVSRMVAALALELLDARGRWVPESEAAELGSVTEELADVTVAGAELIQAVRCGAGPEAIQALTATYVREAEEVAAAARGAR